MDFIELFLGSQIGGGQVQGVEGERGERDFGEGSSATSFWEHVEDRFNENFPTCKYLLIELHHFVKWQ